MGFVTGHGFSRAARPRLSQHFVIPNRAPSPARVQADVDARWSLEAEKMVPGELALDRVAQSFGVRFRKDNGDSEKLARLIPPKGVNSEIRALLESFAAEPPNFP
jgi:hypothetical protein